MLRVVNLEIKLETSKSQAATIADIVGTESTQNTYLISQETLSRLPLWTKQRSRVRTVESSLTEEFDGMRDIRALWQRSERGRGLTQDRGVENAHQYDFHERDETQKAISNSSHFYNKQRTHCVRSSQIR